MAKVIVARDFPIPESARPKVKPRTSTSNERKTVLKSSSGNTLFEHKGEMENTDKNSTDVPKEESGLAVSHLLDEVVEIRKHPKEKPEESPTSSPGECCSGVEQVAEDLPSCNIPAVFPHSEQPFIDTHCHLDFIYGRVEPRTPRMGLEEWIKQFPESFPSNFHGCIPNFVQPSLFVPESKDPRNYDKKWIYEQVAHEKVLGASYGVHPHFSEGFQERKMESALRKLYENRSESKAVAVGECGLDFVRSSASPKDQQFAFEAQLRLAAEYGLPVIIHCRSPRHKYKQVEKLCLETMKEILPRFHHIHRHCFMESFDMAKEWLRVFPNTYFGFTCSIEKLDFDLSAVRNLPLDRILLETDAPYFKPRSFTSENISFSLPGMAIAVADLIAKERNISIDEVINRTRLNTLHAYDLIKY